MRKFQITISYNQPRVAVVNVEAEHEDQARDHAFDLLDNEIIMFTDVDSINSYYTVDDVQQID